MIPQLLSNVSKPSALLLIQLLRQADATALQEALLSLADGLPLQTKEALAAKLLADQEPEATYRVLEGLWGADSGERAAELALSLEPEQQKMALTELIASADGPLRAAAAAELRAGRSMDAATQLPLLDGAADGDAAHGDVAPLELSTLVDAFALAARRVQTTPQPPPAADDVASGVSFKKKPTGLDSPAGVGAKRRMSTARRGSISAGAVQAQEAAAAAQPLQLSHLPHVWAAQLAQAGGGKKYQGEVWPLPKLLTLIAQLYHDKVADEEKEEKSGAPRTSW